VSQEQQGWSFPANSKKAHYFLANEIRSLCMKWMYAGEREDSKDDSLDNCKDCIKRLAAMRKKQAKGVKP